MNVVPPQTVVALSTALKRYRHVTNLRTPLDPIDQVMLLVADDYRLGPPVPGDLPTSFSLEELVKRGYVGMYMTAENFITNLALQRRTGWPPSFPLGQELGE